MTLREELARVKMLLDAMDAAQSALRASLGTRSMILCDDISHTATAEANDACITFIRHHAAEIAALAGDAERYRWLAANACSIAGKDGFRWIWNECEYVRDTTLDAAIDTALRDAGGGAVGGG